MEQDADRDIPILTALVREIAALCDRVQGASIPPNDRFAEMCLLFMSTQAEHAEALLTLVKIRSRDAKLIARAMAEGMAMLRWACASPTERGPLWSAYSLVQGWKAAKASGDSTQVAEIEARAELQWFLTRDAKERIAAGDPPKVNPFVHVWYKGSLRDLFDGIDPRFYEPVYSDFAEYHHWSPRGLAPAVKREGASLGHYPAQPNELAQSLAVGFHSLYDLLTDANRYLKLGLEEDLARLLERHPAYSEIVAAANADKTASNGEI